MFTNSNTKVLLVLLFVLLTLGFPTVPLLLFLIVLLTMGFLTNPFLLLLVLVLLQHLYVPIVSSKEPLLIMGPLVTQILLVP